VDTSGKQVVETIRPLPLPVQVGSPLNHGQPSPVGNMPRWRSGVRGEGFHSTGSPHTTAIGYSSQTAAGD
jgi:hypothetical protein